MGHSRRDFIMMAGAATGALAGSRVRADEDKRPVLGLIFPPAKRGAPEEGLEMYGSQIRFVTTGLGLKTMTPDGYDAVIDQIGPAAKELAGEGAQAVVLMGTSLELLQGRRVQRHADPRQCKEASGLARGYHEHRHHRRPARGRRSSDRGGDRL